MKPFRSFFAPWVVLSLVACTNGDQPRVAEFVPPAESQTDFGDLRVHYNALPTLSLSEAVAREYGVARDADTALVVIAVRKRVGGEESAAQAEVDAVATDLQGMRQPIALRVAKTGDYSDHIGSMQVSARDSYRIEVNVRSGGRNETLEFQRNF